MTAVALEAAATEAGLTATVADSVDAAMGEILAPGGAPGRILICGSHYLVGALLADNG
jgi:folylpolyglutamate synthase/dihydropteroate synthase